MDADLAALPDDIAALKAALAIERARVRAVLAERAARAVELAVARAKASEDLALIAHQKLRIALPRPPAARARGDRPADDVRLLWRNAAAQAG
jgi:transposase